MTATSERWERLWQSAGLGPAPLDWRNRLLASYSEPHRHYHNLQHISECLQEFDVAKHLAKQPAAIELALWFHDAIYDPRAVDNEERSADLARQCLVEANAAKELTDVVADLVLATKHHHGTSADAALMIDVDLSILGQSGERFDQYEKAIRAEYSWVPAAVFATKRAEILERFLQRARIYRTELLFQRYEASARRNLEKSLLALRTARE